MPIVDGLSSTKMIRSFERRNDLESSPRRIPIIAVSASLVEKDKQVYVDAGFDGWILKPISFARLNELLTGIHDPSTRAKSIYVKGEWERGGWFSEDQQQPPSPAQRNDTPGKS
jgi:CheY-like chemotaxis protein